MEMNEKMNEQTEVKEDVVTEAVVTEVATDSGDNEVEIRVESIKSSGETINGVEETKGGAVTNADPGSMVQTKPAAVEGDTVEREEATETEMGRDDDHGEVTVAEMVERARQEGYDSGYSRGYEEARGKSIDEWMHESMGDAGEEWDYGGESEVMILNNIRPSVWE